MADTKLSGLVELAATPAVDDEVYIRDVSEAPIAESKRITVANLIAAYLPLAGGTLTGPLIIDDDTYIQLGDTEGMMRLLPHSVGGDYASFRAQPGAGNRYGAIVLMPKGTEDRTQLTMYNVDSPTGANASSFNIEVNGDTVTLIYEDTGTPPTSIAHLHVENIWEFQTIKPISNLLSSIGASDKKWTDIFAEHHQITQAIPTDHRWAGITAPMTAGTALTIGQAVYVGGDSKMEKALATAAATMPAIALATGTIAENASGEFLMQGFFRDDTWNWTIGGLLYVSRATAGALTQTLPAIAGEQVQVVGVAITADIIHFNPSLELVEIS